MPDSSEYSMKSTESKLKLSQSHKNNSIFSRIYNLFKNGLLNELDDEQQHAKIKNHDSKKKLIRKKVTMVNKVTKSPRTKTIKIKNKQLAKVLQDKKTVSELKNNQEQFNIPIKPPVLESLKLRTEDTQKPIRNTVPHNDTYEGKKNIKPQIIQLGPRKAIRIDPNSSTSSVSLSPPAVPVSQSTIPVLQSTVPVSQSTVPESPPAVSVSSPTLPASRSFVPMSPLTVPVSPPTVSLSPPAVSVSSPAVSVSQPAFPPTLSRLLFYETMHGSQLTPTQHIATSNTSTPFRSRSRMIRVNTIEDLGESQNNNRPIKEPNSSSLQGNINELLGVSTTKEKKKKRKKSKDGQKRKRRRELQREEDKKILRLDESNDKVAPIENGVNSFSSASEATRNFNVNNIYNPFITNADIENTASKMMKAQDNIGNTLIFKGPYDLSQNPGVGTNDRTENSLNLANSKSHKNEFGSHFETNLQSLNVVPKEVGDISKLFMSSDIDSEEDKVILEYRSKSRQYSELKWPGHDSIGDIILQNESTTPDKRQSKVIDSSKKAHISNKPRLLSEIMAEKYQMDGISFLGKFRTPHIPLTADYQSSDESRSITEQKQESPVYKKFGIDIRKERFRGEGRQDDNNNVN